MARTITAFQLSYGQQPILIHCSLLAVYNVIQQDFTADKLIAFKSYEQYTREIKKKGIIQILIPDRPSIFIKTLEIQRSFHKSRKEIAA